MLPSKKLQKGLSSSRDSSPIFKSTISPTHNSRIQHTTPEGISLILNYILSQANNDFCPYVDVDIFGIKFKALLDSGANQVFMNSDGWKVFDSLGIKLENTNVNDCISANNESSHCVGKVCIPISLENKTVVFDVYIIPSLRHTLILGTNFWIQMGIIPDLRKQERIFSQKETDEHLTHISSCFSDTKMLLPDQLNKLNSIINKYFDDIKNIKLGCTEAIKHVIEVRNDAKPVKKKMIKIISS